MILPFSIDKTPKGILIFGTDLGDGGYAENVEFILQTSKKKDGLHFKYYGEDDTYLNDEHLQEILIHAIKQNNKHKKLKRLTVIDVPTQTHSFKENGLKMEDILKDVAKTCKIIIS